jgi:hypothetical protein
MALLKQQIFCLDQYYVFQHKTHISKKISALQWCKALIYLNINSLCFSNFGGKN